MQLLFISFLSKTTFRLRRSCKIVFGKESIIVGIRPKRVSRTLSNSEVMFMLSVYRSTNRCDIRPLAKSFLNRHGTISIFLAIRASRAGNGVQYFVYKGANLRANSPSFVLYKSTIPLVVAANESLIFEWRTNKPMQQNIGIMVNPERCSVNLKRIPMNSKNSETSIIQTMKKMTTETMRQNLEMINWRTEG